MKPTHFKTTTNQKIPLPVFFPDATQAVVKSLDTIDIKKTKTPGILVNTYHLYLNIGKTILISHKGIANFMSWDKAVISDSGGFQVMSIAKKQSKNSTTDKGVRFKPPNKKSILFTPEDSISFQMLLRPDMVVVLDDFTTQTDSYQTAKQTVKRTIDWAVRSKIQFEKIIKQQKLPKSKTPYLLAIVQGGEYLDLREYCTRQLVKIGFDGLGYGGWPIDKNGKFNYRVAKLIADITPDNYLLYGLGIGKPEEIVGCAKLGYHIFDCVLPTRDARHKRLYLYNTPSIDKININDPNFYSYYIPDQQKHYHDSSPISTACDCTLCKNYSRSYLAHLFRIKEFTAGRLASIHNLRFYSILMEKLQQNPNFNC